MANRGENISNVPLDLGTSTTLNLVADTEYQLQVKKKGVVFIGDFEDAPDPEDDIENAFDIYSGNKPDPTIKLPAIGSLYAWCRPGETNRIVVNELA